MEQRARTIWPPTVEAATQRVGVDPQQLLFALQRLCTDSLNGVVEAALRHTDDYLFDRAQAGSDGVELTALRDLRLARGQIVHRFGQATVAGFRAFTGLVAVDGKPELVLSLVEEEDLQQQLADEQLIDNLRRLHAQALAPLEARLTALAARASLPGGDNPAGPKALARAMRDGLRGAALSPNVVIVLFKFLERELGEALQGVYARMNERLAAAGILPTLEAPAPKPQPKAETTPTSEVPAPEGAAGMSGAETAFFNSLVGLLQGWRQRIGGTQGSRPMSGGQGMAMPSSDVMSVLHRMQQQPPAGLALALDEGSVSLADQLRRELLGTAQRLGMASDGTGLQPADEDALDLVGMLFDVLMDERDFEPDARRKIGRLLVPYVRVAVKDRRLFLYKGHPARRLLNAVAEACEGNRGEGPQEQQLLGHVDGVIERVVAEYNEDLAIFETLEQELRGYLDQHRKRMELGEKRAAESQRGRERLEQAREIAATEVALQRGDRELPPALGEFLSHYVTHHLTQVVLRDGPTSPRYAEALHAVMGLLVSFDHAELGAPPLPLQRDALLAVLESSGCVEHAAEETLAALQHTLARIADGDGSAEQQVLPAPPPMPAPPPPPLEPMLAGVSQGPELDFDAAVADQVRALELGSWLQLTSENGRSEPAKVSWVSPISGRLLFVNRRGIRVLVASVEELAAMVKVGRVALRGVNNAFEDSMRLVMDKLQAETRVDA